MSEQDNLEKVRRAYKAFAEGDLPTLLSLVTDDLRRKLTCLVS
jgi:ketosteroid isomerase-like protein